MNRRSRLNLPIEKHAPQTPGHQNSKKGRIAHLSWSRIDSWVEFCKLNSLPWCNSCSCFVYNVWKKTCTSKQCTASRSYMKTCIITFCQLPYGPSDTIPSKPYVVRKPLGSCICCKFLKWKSPIWTLTSSGIFNRMQICCKKGMNCHYHHIICFQWSTSCLPFAWLMMIIWLSNYALNI